MSPRLAASLSAVRHSCNGLRYVSGDRADGVVKPGREKPLLFPTGSILALQQLDLANSFLKQLQFGAAKEIIDRIRDDLVNEKDRKLAEELSDIAAVYDRWDKFDHQGFLHEYKKLKFRHRLTKPYKIGKRTLQLLHELVRDQKKNTYSFLGVADLLNNAERRALEGKFDDAVARIYRAVEMLGQCRLQEEHGISANSVDLSKLSHQELKDLHLDQDRKKAARIALTQVFQLLASRSDKIGLAYVNNAKLQDLLKARNMSILAHGSEPVDRATYSSLLDEAFELCREHNRSIGRLRKSLQFPWLALR